MTRARSLSYLLWSTLVPGLIVGPTTGCGDDDDVGRLPDGPLPPRDAPAIDAAALDAQLIDAHLGDAGADAGPGAPALMFSVPELSMKCGDQEPDTGEVVLTNIGGSDLVISGIEIDGGFAVTAALPFTIAAGTAVPLAVRPPLAVIGTDRGAAIREGTLRVTTNEPGAPTRTIALAATVIGANLEFTDDAGSPITIALSGNATCPAPAEVFLRNTGNRPITVDAPSASQFAFAGFSGGTIAPGNAATQQIRVSVTNSCSGTESILYGVGQSQDPVCTGSSTVPLVASYNLIGLSPCSCN